MSSVFVAADYSQIEARVLAWLAGQQDILDVFARGDDVYTYTAERIGSADRQLGKVCVLGLGFGMGFAKFVESAAAAKPKPLILTEEFARETVREWRAANQKIVGLWYKLDDTFCAAINSPPGSRLPVPGHENIVIERGKDALGIFLPSKKRRLIYRNPRLVYPEPQQPELSAEQAIALLSRDDVDRDLVVASAQRGQWQKNKRSEIHYDGVQQYSRQWGPIKTYGGKLAENVTQAVARDVMATGMLRMDEDGLDLRMTVHDEVIAVAPEHSAKFSLELMLNIMRTPPEWAPGLPVWAEGWTGTRYRK